MEQLLWFIAIGGGMLAMLAFIQYASHSYNLDGIKSKTVGDGQYGTAYFATNNEIASAYHCIPYRPKEWRMGKIYLLFRV